MHYEKNVNKKKLTHIRVHPKTCSTSQLYGWLSEDGFHTWNDGILTQFLRYANTLKIWFMIGEKCKLKSQFFFIC